MNISEDYDKLQRLLRRLEEATKIKENVEATGGGTIYVTIEYRNITIDYEMGLALSNCLIDLLRTAAIKQGEELTEKIKGYALPISPTTPPDFTVPTDAVGLSLSISLDNGLAVDLPVVPTLNDYARPENKRSDTTTSIEPL